jgi:flagellar biosynthesis protein
MTDEPRAPRKIAVALGYEAPGAPRVLAKGQGAVAEAILAAARENGVAIEANAPLAEALARVEVDQEIPEALYRVVAEVIAFVIRARDGIR